MFGSFDGGRLDPTERASSGKPSSARSQTLANEASALKAAQALRIDANQQTPQAEGGPSTIAELVAHYRLKELAGEKQGTQGVLDASCIRMLSEELDSSSLGRSQI